MRRLLQTDRLNALLAWLALGGVLLATAVSVARGAFGWTVLGVGLAGLMLLPPVARRSVRLLPPWPIVAIAAGALAGGLLATGLWATVAAYVVLGTLAMTVVLQLELFTPVRMNRGVAVALVFLATVATAGLWELSKWLLDLTVGTSLVATNEGVMWRLIAATGVGLVAAVGFERSLHRLSRAALVPDGFGPGDADGQVAAAGDAVARALERVGIDQRRQRWLVRGMQVLLACFVLFGLVRLQTDLIVNASIALGVTWLPNVLRRDYDLQLDAGLTLWITLAVFLHSLGTLGLYDLLGWHYVAHTVSATLVAGVGYAAVRALETHTPSIAIPPKFAFVIVVLFVVAAGVLWEILEFSLDQISVVVGAGSLVLAQHGLTDTMVDLLFDTLGGVLVAALATLYRLR